MTNTPKPEALASLVERLRDILPLLDGLETGRDCEEYAFAKAGGFQAMTYCPEAFEALRCIPEAATTITTLAAERDALREACEAVREAMREPKVLESVGWSITKLNKARPLIHAALERTAQP